MVPELPDIEGFRRILQDHVVGSRIERVQVCDPGVVRERSSADFVRQLEGRRFGQPERRGKWLLARTEGPTLLFHFGMTGRLVWEPPDVEPLRFERVTIYLKTGKLAFRDQRKLGGLWIVDDDDGVSKVIGQQGPDALGLSGPHLEECLAARRGSLKTAMMDQGVIAGLGNMLSDEVLWRAHIYPGRRFISLESFERQELDRALQRVLRACVKVGEIPRSASWLSSQRSRSDPRCPRCRAPLMRSRVGGRTSYWCAVCQPAS
jgi:formamidopyrimidine-DNA glycosylase